MDRRTLQRKARTVVRARIMPVLLVVAAVTAGAQETTTAPAQPVFTLRDCVRIALDSSLRLGVADEQRLIAEKDVKEAWGAFLPNLSLSATYSKNHRTDFDLESTQYTPGEYPYVGSNPDTLWLPAQVPVGTTVEDEKITSTYKDLSASAALRLFDGFANINNLKAAQAAETATEFSRGYTREQVVQNVAMAYYNLLRNLALRDVKVEDLDRAQKELERTETYFRLGSAAKADVLQQRVFVENTRLELVTAENQVKQAQADLAYAMNQPLAEDFEVDRSPLQTEMAVEPVETLYQEAKENRLDLQALAYDREATEKRAAAAGGAFWPRIDVAASFTRYNNESPYRFGSQTSQSISYRGTVSWDVFNRFQNWTQHAKAKANARIAEYNLEQAQLDAQLEIRRYHIAMTEAIERRQVSQETIAQAEEELRLAQERFRVGAGTNLDRISAEVNLAQARADEVQAIADFLIARIQLYRALGRFTNLVPEES